MTARHQDQRSTRAGLAQGGTDCDVLVIGSGAGGLSAALASAKRGLRTIVLEKDALFGGTSAWSGGWIWIPCNPLAVRDGIADSLDDARRYLQARLADQYEAELVDAYLESGPQMVAEYGRDTAVQFESAGYVFPDYHPETSGSVHGAGTSRSLRAMPLDARELCPSTLRNLRPALRQTTLHGMMLASLSEAQHFVDATRSLESALFVARKSGRYLLDWVRYRRDMSLVNGNALIGRLAKSLDDLGVPILVRSPATDLLLEGDAVRGAMVLRDEKPCRIAAHRGVVLACGGFSHDRERQRRFYSHVAAGAVHLPVAPDSVTGDGLSMAEGVGGYVVEDRPWNCLFMPTSRLPDVRGSAVVPHVWDRSKPGFIAVTPDGRRFVNEAASYMNFGQAMVRHCDTGRGVYAWLVCDHAALRRYGLGAARPMLRLAPFLRNGYLKRAATIAELATVLGCEPRTLSSTIADYNHDARVGVDRGFGKGGDAFSRFQGDARASPNPNMAPLSVSPFYAVQIFCGDFGTFTGLKTNAHGQVLRRGGAPIAGLYAAGSDMATMMGSHSVGGGITLGPAMVFGYRAAKHMASEEDGVSRTRPRGGRQA